LAHNIEFELGTLLEIKEPKKYKVILLNDDYSTIDFVMDILQKIFKKSSSEAEKITLDIHHNEKAVCGVYSHEIAQTKVVQVKINARKARFPLKAILEEEE
jgi:ATP-dependent Clp protease adaptor protein ClpS